jgi:hypothetical protein
MLKLITNLIILFSLISCKENSVETLADNAQPAKTEKVHEMVKPSFEKELITSHIAYKIKADYNKSEGCPGVLSVKVIRKFTSEWQQENHFSHCLDSTQFVKEYHYTDLNGDGYAELFVLINNDDAEGSGGILGITEFFFSRSEKIIFPGITNDLAYGKGYVGIGEKYSIADNMIILEFPVYGANRLTGGNWNPTGKMRRIYYTVGDEPYARVVRFEEF